MDPTTPPSQAQPSGVDVIHDAEQSLARSANKRLSSLGQSPRVIDFLDTQRHKIERGEWTATSFHLDRIALAWSAEWRGADPQTRREATAHLVAMGNRIQQVEHEISAWEHVRDLGGQLNIALQGVPGKILDKVALTTRVARRRDEAKTAHETRGPSNPSSVR